MLEGPEHSVFVRGNTVNKVIELPDYWTGLVHKDSLTVQLTPIGNDTTHFLVKIEDNKVYIDSSTGLINVSYLVVAERKDIDRIDVEYKK